MKTNVTRTNMGTGGVDVGVLLSLLLLVASSAWALDADGDFMEDQWEVQYGLDPGDTDDALLDLDGDTIANLCEYLHNSDPNNAEQIPTEHVTIRVPTAVGTIQGAIDMSINGDTVLVQPGIYEETLSFSDKEIRVTGSVPHDPAVVAATVINPNNRYYDIVTFMSSHKATSILEGVTLTRGQRGIYCHGLASPVLTHCVLENNSVTGLTISGHADADVTVSHCRVIGNGSDGVVCGNSRLYLHHTVVAKNGNAGSAGVVLYGGDAGYSRIHNCTVVGHGYRGIRTSSIGDEQPDIVNCIVWDNGDDLLNCFATETNPHDIRQIITQAGLSGENILQWNGCDPNGDILEKDWYVAVVDANANGVLSQAQSNASQLRYDHTVGEVLCQPGRFFPLHNEITRITYDASPDADMTVEIYDPAGNLFCAYAMEAADPNEILWQGTDRALGDPAGRYPAQPGTYRIEARFQGMRERNQTRVEVYR